MADEATQVADVNATQDKVEEVNPTTTTEVSSEGKKGTDEKAKSDQAKADAEIAKDLAKEDKKKAKEESDGSLPDEEEPEEPEDKPEDEAQSETDEEKAAEVAKGAEARKLALQTEIRGLVSKRNELRGEVEDLNAKAYRTETPEELAEKGLSPEEAENEILKQEMQLKDFNIHVADLNQTLNIESLQVMQDFPVFDPGTEENPNPLYDKSLADRVRKLYQQAAQPVVDKKTGLVTKSNLPPYEFYKAFAETHQASGAKSRAEGAIEGKKAADKELAAAETTSSAAPRKKAEDPFLKGLLSKDD